MSLLHPLSHFLQQLQLDQAFLSISFSCQNFYFRRIFQRHKEVAAKYLESFVCSISSSISVESTYCLSSLPSYYTGIIEFFLGAKFKILQPSSCFQFLADPYFNIKISNQSSFLRIDKPNSSKFNSTCFFFNCFISLENNAFSSTVFSVCKFVQRSLNTAHNSSTFSTNKAQKVTTSLLDIGKEQLSATNILLVFRWQKMILSLTLLAYIILKTTITITIIADFLKTFLSKGTLFFKGTFFVLHKTFFLIFYYFLEGSIPFFLFSFFDFVFMANCSFFLLSFLNSFLNSRDLEFSTPYQMLEWSIEFSASIHQYSDLVP